MIIKCGICGKDKSVTLISSADIMPDVGWICDDCLTSDPMSLKAVSNSEDKI